MAMSSATQGPAVSENNNNNRVKGMIVDDDIHGNNNTSGPHGETAGAALPHAASSVSISSKASSSSLKKKQQQQQQHYQQQAETLLINQQAATMIENARLQQMVSHLQQKQQLEQLQELQAQQEIENHRRNQRLRMHRENPLNGSLNSSIGLAGTDHSAFSGPASRKVSIPGVVSTGTTPFADVLKTSQTSLSGVSNNSVHHVLDASNSSSLESSEDAASALLVSPNPSLQQQKADLSEKERLSIFHKEFQFPWKLYEMLERACEDNFSHLVGWMPGDKCFKVFDPDEFVRSVMPLFFKQTKYKR